MTAILKKITSMSLHEVSHRLRVASSRRMLRYARTTQGNPLASDRFLPGLTLPSDYDGPYSDAVAAHKWRTAEKYLLEHVRARQAGDGYYGIRPRFFVEFGTRDDSLALVSEHFPQIISNTLEQAERLLMHRFRFLGITTHFENGIDWQIDPVSRRKWPESYYSDIKFYGQDEAHPGDVKHVWELNRHQHLVVLAKAYWLSGDERYASEVVAQMKSWIRQNTYLYGINWTSALEVAIRSVSWLWAYFFCLGAGVLDGITNAQILRTLHLHGSYLSNNLSFFTSPYNHLIGEAAALFCLGMLFPEFKEATAWRNRGWEILESEVEKQFHSDGISVEQAISYHHFTLGFYLLAMLLAKRNDIPVSSQMLARLQSALDFSMYTMQPDGTHPMIGDNDDARSIYLGERRAWDFRDLLAVGAVLFARGDFKKAAGSYEESCLWLLGPESFKGFNDLEPQEPVERNRLFDHSGYAVLRSGWETDDHALVFDCGEQSHGLSANEMVSTAHGHADFFNVVLSAFGTPMLVDSGMLTYNGDLQWQNYFRTGEAHNTVTVDAESASHVVGRLGYSHVPAVERAFTCIRPELAYVEASYKDIRFGHRHRRSIFFSDRNYWLICDGLYGTGTHKIDRWLHFAPLINVRLQGESVVAAGTDNKNLLIRDLGPSYGASQLTCGGSEPRQGWLAPGYGSKIKAPVVRLHSNLAMPVQFAMLVMPFRGAMPTMKHEISGQHGSQSPTPFSLVLRADNWVDVLIFNFTGRAQETLSFESDAKIIYVKSSPTAGKASVMMVHGTRFCVSGQCLHHSDYPIDANFTDLQIDLESAGGQ